MPRITAKRLLIWTAEAIAGLLAMITVVFLLSFWALNQGWVSAKTLMPFVADMVNEILPDFDVDIGAIEAVWLDQQEFALIRLRNVVLSPRSGGVASRVRRADISFSTTALLTARLAPSGIKILGADINWQDSAPVAGDQRLERDEARFLFEGIGWFFSSPINGAIPALSYLRKVDIREARIKQISSDGQIKWEGRDIYFSFLRPYLAQNADFSAGSVIQIGDSAHNVKLSGRILPHQELVRVELESNHLPVRIFELAAPHLSQILDLDMTVQSRFQLDMTREGIVHFANLRIESPQGHITAPFLLKRGYDVKNMLLNADLDFTQHILKINEVSFDNPREKNIRSKLSGDLDFSLFSQKRAQGDLPDNSFISDFVSHITAAADFEGIDFVYFREMKPIQNARGSCSLRESQMHCDVKEGRIVFAQGPLLIKNGLFEISDIIAAGSRAAIDFEASGAPNIFSLWLDSFPYNYFKMGYFLDAAYGGKGAFKADMSWPFRNSTFENMQGIGKNVFFNIEFDIYDLKTIVHFPAFQVPLMEGNLSVSLTEKAYAINGHGRFGGAVMHINQKGSFKPADQKSAANIIDQELNLDMLINDSLLRSIGLDGVINIDGEAHLITALSKKSRGDFFTGSANLDLTDPSLSQFILGWRKKEGESSALNFDIVWGRDGIELNRINLQGGGMAARGEVKFAKKGRLISAKFPMIAVRDKNSARLDITRRENGVLMADIYLARWDLREDFGLSSGGIDISDLQEASSSSGQILIKARIGELIGHHGVRLRALTTNAYRKNGQIEAFDMKGKLYNRGKASPFRALISEEGDKRRLSLRAGDAGAVLRGLNLYSNIHGGALFVTAALPNQSNESTPASDQNVAGKIRVRKFYVKNTPVLTRILGATSWGGLTNAMAGKGIFFNKMEASFTQTPEQIILDEGWAVGTALGVSLQGAYQRAAPYKISMHGTLTPAYIINSFFSTLPGLGTLLTSRKGEGILGISFSVEGTSAAPEVNINPLSMMAPGILRRLFEFGGNEIDAPKENSPEKK